MRWNSTPFRLKLVTVDRAAPDTQADRRPARAERPALWAVLISGFAIATLALAVKRPDLVSGPIYLDIPSSPVFGIIGAVMCGFAVRRSVLRALPGIAINLVYWAFLVAALQ
jgi:hypothetical protein